MRAAVQLASLAFVLLAVGCGSDTCEPTPSFGYDCEAQADPTNTCTGGPTIDGTQHDADKNFPIGCHAGARTCVDGDEQIAEQCECISGFAGNTWACS